MLEEHDKLATRLILILTKFNSGERLSVEDLAEEFNVSDRTIQRDLKKLSYLPIEKSDGCYSLEAYALGKLSYKDIKQFATFSGIRELYPDLNDSLIVDILNTRVNKTLEVRGHKYEDLSRKVDAFNTIATALVIQKQIVFSYTQKHRTVNPYKLINTNGIWYLVGVEDGVLKNFSFSKITELESLEDTFKIDKYVIETLKNHNGVWFTQNHIEVVLEIDLSVAEYFLRRELLPSQKTIESTDEMLVLSTQVAYEEEILKVVRYWIPHITIRSPHHLQEKLEESLQNYLNKS